MSDLTNRNIVKSMPNNVSLRVKVLVCIMANQWFKNKTSAVQLEVIVVATNRAVQLRLFTSLG